MLQTVTNPRLYTSHSSLRIVTSKERTKAASRGKSSTRAALGSRARSSIKLFTSEPRSAMLSTAQKGRRASLLTSVGVCSGGPDGLVGALDELGLEVPSVGLPQDLQLLRVLLWLRGGGGASTGLLAFALKAEAQILDSGLADASFSHRLSLGWSQNTQPGFGSDRGLPAPLPRRAWGVTATIRRDPESLQQHEPA